MNYKGSCHCGQIAFEVDGEIAQLTDCNCSICSRKGALLWFVPREQFRLLTPVENLSTYTFNKHVIQHRFCAHCGVNPFAEAKEMVGGFFLIDVATRDEAVAIASRCPAARWASVEVRECAPCYVA